MQLINKKSAEVSFQTVMTFLIHRLLIYLYINLLQTQV